MSKRQNLEVVVAGLAVVDLIGRPVRLDRLPRRGGLQLLDSITLTTGGNACNCAIDLKKLGFRNSINKPRPIPTPREIRAPIIKTFFVCGL